MSRWTIAFLLLACAGRGPPAAHAFSFLSPRAGRGGRSSSTRGAPPDSHSRARVRRIALLASSPSSASNPAVDPASSPAAAILDFYANLDNLYDKSISIKCPFFRRRAADLIDGAAMVVQFLLIRHKSLPGVSDLFLDYRAHPLDEASGTVTADSFADFLSAPGCKPLGRHIKRHPDGTARKTRGLPIAEISERIRGDWTGGSEGTKGYYITGRLDSTIYRDDCLFTGPDPDMPVRGLRKYLSAAAHLFDPKQSDAELLSISYKENGGEKGLGLIEVKWKLGGVIQLPWHPTVEPWTGTTRYHLDEEGLVYLHQEGWDISVWRAFVCTLYPEAKDWRIWGLEKISVHV